MNTQNAWKRLMPKLLPYWKDFAFAALSMAVVAALSSLSISFIKPLIDKILVEKDIEKLKMLALAMPLVFFIKSAFSYLLNYLLPKIGQAVGQNIRQDLTAKIVELDHAFHVQTKSADLLARATNDVAAVGNMVANAPLFIIRDGLTLICLFGLIFYLNAPFAAKVMISIPLFAWLFVVFTSKLKKVTKKAQELIAAIYGTIAEALGGISIIKIFLYEKIWMQKFQKQNHEYLRAMLKYQKLTALSPSLNELLSGFVMTFVLLLGGMEVVKGLWSPGDFITFLGAAFMAYQPIKRLSQVNAIVQLGLSSYQRILEILDIPVVIRNHGQAATWHESLRFINAGLVYPDGRRALNNINFEIKKGEIVGLAGPSGSGKTTVAVLLPRLYDPTEGSITIDGRDIKNIELASLRRLFAFVTQEAFLFDDTIAANIAVGSPAANKEEIIDAAKAAYAWPFIERLPLGLETHVGERGVKLSAGQRQRLAIARAILKKPQILVLDEATSNLDPESEEYVFSALETLLQDKTALIISHRIQTLQWTNRIIVMERGEIVEETTHGQFAATAGSRLARLMG